MQPSPRAVLIGLLSCLLAACTSPVSPLSPGEVRALREAEARWAARPFQAYTYEIVTSCGECPHFILQWARVAVGDGQVVDVGLVANDSALAPQDWASFTTIDGLFAMIRGYQQADWVRDVIVEFDPQLGYPTAISTFAKPGIADAGGSHFTRNLVPTANATSTPIRPAIGQPFSLHIGQTARFPDADLSVTFQAVPEDSRCPTDVVCVWEGNGKVQLQVRSGAVVRTVALNTTTEPRAVALDGYQLRLEQLAPVPKARRPVPPSEYVATLKLQPQ